VAAAQDICVVNAGYTYNEELLLRLPEVFENVRVEAVGAATLAQSFADLTLDEREKCFELLKVAQVALQPFRAAGDMRKFEPAELAALFTTDPDAACRARSIRPRTPARRTSPRCSTAFCPAAAPSRRRICCSTTTARSCSSSRRCKDPAAAATMRGDAVRAGAAARASSVVVARVNLLNTGLSALIKASSRRAAAAAPPGKGD
jgi:hypothetical protein